MTKEELIALAKEMYPIGTKCKCLSDLSGETIETIESNNFIIKGIKKVINLNTHYTRVIDIDKNLFAEIVEKPDPNKEIKKWSVGSYVLFLKNLCHIKKGYIDVIEEGLDSDHTVFLKEYCSLSKAREDDGEVKWFATKSEAEEYAKTLTNSIKTTDTLTDKNSNKFEFEVGKWYYGEYPTKWYFKYVEQKRIYVYAYEFISVEDMGYYKKSDLGYLENLKTIREATLEEIQKYLPDDHTDKLYEVTIKNPCSEVFLNHSNGKLDRSNNSIFPTFEEKPLIQMKELQINKNYFQDFKDPYINK